MAKKSGKFILSVGDEGAILTYMQGKAVVRRLYAPTASYSDTKHFLELLQSDAKAPVSMLVDMMDQSYVQHTLPPVSPLTINNLIKRKMERDFAAEDLKGALKIGREKEGRRDWKYLFVTLSHSPQLQSWLELVMEQPNQFSGIYLLPVEAENFILRMQEAVMGKPKKKKKGELQEEGSKWQLLVAHNKVGGFRQVVLRNGKLIFARLAQPIGDNQPEVIAGNIEQEISVTIEYLKRLGYSDEQGMDVYVVTSEFIKSSIDTSNIHAASANVYTPHEAALHLGLEQITEPNDQFADVLMSAAFATSKKHLLKLETKEQQQLSKLYSGLAAVKVGGALVSVGAVAAAIYYGILIPGAKEEMERYTRQTKAVEQELAQVMELERSLPDDLEKMTDLVEMYKRLNDLGMQPFDALSRFSRSAEKSPTPVMLADIEWEVSNSGITQATQGSTASSRNSSTTGDADNGEKMQLLLTVDMYGTEVGSQQFDEYIDGYLEALQEAYAGYTVALKTERPSRGRPTSFSLGEDAQDPITAKPFFTVKIDISGTGVVAEDDAANNAMNDEGYY